MKKKIILLSGVLLIMFLINFFVIIHTGNSYNYHFNSNEKVVATDVQIDNEKVARVEKITDNSIVFKPVSPGETIAVVFCKSTDSDYGVNEYITLNVTYFNTIYSRSPVDFNGKFVPIISGTIFMAMLIVNFIFALKNSVKKTFYSYKNIVYIGVIIFLSMLEVVCVATLSIAMASGVNNNELSVFILGITSSGTKICLILFIPVIVMLLMISFSNLTLLRYEGKSVKNILGIIFGFAITAGLFAVLSVLKIYNDYSDHSATAYTVASLTENLFSYIIIYFDCMFLGAVICSLRATKIKPSLDKDYVIILGCGIRKDGTLLPLLKGRVDRAISFVNEQMKKTGKKCVFVPSGGQGSDEIMPEAQAMKNYLLKQGFKESDILIENKSTTTLENMKFSKMVIEEERTDANVLFSTTNYHLFRSGMYAQ